MTHAPLRVPTAALGARLERLCADWPSPHAFALAKGFAFAIAFAIVFAIVFAFACKPPPPPPPPPSPSVATIDGVSLPLSLVQTELDRLRRSSGTPGSKLAPAAQGRALLDQLIDQRLVVARARRERLLVSDADVQRELDELDATAAAVGKTLKERLAAEGMTEEELTRQLRERVLSARWLSQQLKVEHPTAAELKAAYGKLLSEAHPAPEALALDLTVPEQVRCAQLLVASAPEAKAILDQARKGAAFEQLAKKHSLSPDKDAGGDLGFFSRASLPPPFDQCFSLKKNQLSGVLASPYGFHLLKLLERRPAHRRSLAEVTKTLDTLLVQERRTQAERALLADLRRSARIELHEDVLQQLR